MLPNVILRKRIPFPDRRAPKGNIGHQQEVNVFLLDICESR